MPSIFEENRLIRLLREFDSKLTLSYLENLRKFKEEIHNKDLLHLFTSIEDSTGDTIAFRIEFSEPILVMLSHPLCRMHAKFYYPIERERERFYVTRLGILPVYFVDLNILTLIKFWDEAAKQVSSQALANVLTGEAMCMKLSPADRNIHYSTMNFIIPFGASLWKAPKAIDDIMRRYLTYSLWLSPKQGFSFSTHFLHSVNSIKYLLKVAKTLCLIEEIGRSTDIQILNRKAHDVTIRMLTEKDGSFYFQKWRAFVPEDVVKELSSAQDKDRIKLNESFLNAIVLEVKEKTRSFELLSVVSDIGASYYELAQTMIAYVLMKIFNSNESIAYVCDLDKLKKTYNNMLEQIWRHIKLPLTISDVINSFDLALESHYPIFIRKEDEIWYLHPAVFNFLYSKYHSVFSFQKDDKEKILKLLNFLEKINKGVSQMELLCDETLAMFQGENEIKLLSKLSRLVRIIKISKILRTSF